MGDRKSFFQKKKIPSIIIKTVILQLQAILMFGEPSQINDGTHKIVMSSDIQSQS